MTKFSANKFAAGIRIDAINMARELLIRCHSNMSIDNFNSTADDMIKDQKLEAYRLDAEEDAASSAGKG